jgi:hypothetical protein
LNASTSKEALPGLDTLVDGSTGPSRSASGRSIVSNVFENGFAGAFLGLLIASSSDISDVMLSKGSSFRGTGVGGFAEYEKLSSPIVDAESGIDGDGGGGDCTRTFFVTFFGALTASRAEDPGGGSAC